MIMPKFKVYFSRTDRFLMQVEAPNQHQAMDQAFNAICDSDDPDQWLSDSDGFEPELAEEIKEDGADKGIEPSTPDEIEKHFTVEEG